MPNQRADAHVARRYTRSLANLKAAIQIADEAVVRDNTDPVPFEASHGAIARQAAALPSWADI